ncbi:MAG: hypothetical protein M1538_00355 [Candidatus Marsarchaeota archaeon]|jgi:hypothetical protein|nr:hypothetical protein [Candidatus Marsarchaeota archaeon]
MMKNIIYIGIIILIISMLLLLYESSLLSSNNLVGGISNITVVKNFKIESNSFVSYPVVFNTSAPLTSIIVSKSKINFYFMSNSAFSEWKADVDNGITGLSSAKRLENSGVYYIFNNITNATMPIGLVQNITTVPIFASNTLVLNAGNYEAVIDNMKGSASLSKIVNVSFIYIPPITNATLNNPAFSNLKNLLNESMWFGGAFFVVFLIGLALIIYGLLKNPKSITIKTEEGKEQISLSDVNKLYEGIEKKYKKYKNRRISGKTNIKDRVKSKTKKTKNRK